MNLLLHQVAKDIRYTRWPLVLWLALLALATLPLALKLDTLAPDGAAAARWLMSSNRILLFLVALSSWLIAARVVHADPADSATAFWLTRPLSPDGLLAAKLASTITLFVVLPAAALAAAAVCNGVSGAVGLRLFSEAVLLGLVFLLAIVLLAALTRDLARLVLAAIVVSIGWLTVPVLAAFVQLRPVVAALAWDSALIVGLLLFAAGVAFILREQYRTRSTVRSAWLSVLVVLVVVVVVALWPWNFLGPRSTLDERHFDPAQVSVSLSEPRLIPRAGTIYGRFDVRGVPAGWVVVPTSLSSSLSMPGGRTERYDDETWLAWMNDDEKASVFGATGQALNAVRQVIGGRWLNDPWEAPVSPRAEDRGRTGVRIAMLKVPGDTVRAAGEAGLTGDYRAAVQYAAYRARLVTSVPLQAGSRAKAAGVETTIVGVRRPRAPARGEVELETRTVRPRLVFPRVVPGIAYVLRNKRRGELMIGQPMPDRHASPAVGARYVDLRYEVIDFSAAINQPLTLDDEWLREAELVLVVLTEQGRFTKTVHVPDFRVSSRAPGAAPTGGPGHEE